MSDPVVRVTREAGVEHVELNRPKALNAWTPDLGRELRDALLRASGDPAVRCILITGAGRAFSAGADVKVPRERTPEGDADLHTRLEEIYNPLVLAVREAPKPVVGAVQGAAAGLGCSLALACDLLLMSQDAYLLLAFVHLGVIPDAGSCAFLAERIGLARATQLVMLGERLPAERALDWGLAAAVHPRDALAGEARALAARLAAGPTVALANMKRALSRAAQTGLAEQLAFEAALQQDHATTHDYAEGVAAFKEKRRPEFTGR